MCEATDPPVWVVGLVALYYLEVLHLQPRDVVHWDLEVHRDRPHLLARVGARAHDKFATDGVRGGAHELADRPGNLLGRVVITGALALGARLELDRRPSRRLGHRKVASTCEGGDVRLAHRMGITSRHRRRRRKASDAQGIEGIRAGANADLQAELLLVLGDCRHDGRDPKGDLGVGAERANVEVHQHKLSVRRLQHEHPLRVELVELHALVEIDIVQLDHAIAALASRRDGEVVVERQVQLGRAGQVALHLDGAVDGEGAHLRPKAERGRGVRMNAGSRQSSSERYGAEQQGPERRWLSGGTREPCS
eukprot:scaffold1099_cov122-Isochrysis_galbana.AAC.1